MEDMQTAVAYAVNSDLDDGLLYAEFKTKDEAITYAKDHLDNLPYVDEMEVVLDDEGDIEDVLSYTTIWDHTMTDAAEEETEDDYWDMLADIEAEKAEGKHVIGNTTWFESMDSLVETLEENEDTVECKECFDLFPKVDCIKVDFGYICPVCAEGGTVSEEDLFKMDFPEYEKMSAGNEMIPDEPLLPDEPLIPAESSEESSEEVPTTEPENEITPISTPEEAVPFLVNDEEEAIAGYERAAEVVADSDLENKEEILDTIEHIKEEEEEHIEELTELVDPKEDEVPEAETEPTSEEEVEEIEDPEAEPTALVEDAGIKTWTCWYEGKDIGTVEAATKEEAAELMMSTYPEYQYNNTDWSVELAEALTEHVNEEHAAIESDQELEGTDNAVVDCKAADVVTHSEDEKPVDCKGEKKPLGKPLTEAKSDPFHDAIFEAIDYLTEFSDIFPVPGNIGAANWGELKDDIRYGLSSDFEIAEILMEYMNKDLEISRKHPEMFEDDPQSELTLETYNRLKRAYDRAVKEYEEKYPEDFTEAFTPEEMKEFNMDEDGNSLDGYDTFVRCTWCEEIFPESECDFEYHMGWLCDRCQSAITSRGERLMLITNPTEEDKARVLTEDIEDENEPISIDPAEKPSKNVKMADTTGVVGMDFETACQQFGVSLEN